jgi:predicted amidohydrolase YtcJ
MKTRLLAAAALLIATPALAETHFDNLDGISIRRDGSVDRFSGMVVNEQGQIVQLLDFGDRPTVGIDFYTDMHGATVVPGFVDSHANVMELGLLKLTLDLSGAADLAQAQALVAAYAAEFPGRPWLVGRGWTFDPMPTAADLDIVSDGRPIMLVSADGHAVWANSVALSTAGITAQTADPAGGRIVRRAGLRAPAGVLVDNAMALLTAHVPPPRAADRDLALHEAQQLLFSHGVTAVADMGTTIEDWMAYRRAGDASRLQLRIMSYADSVPTMLLIGGPEPTAWLYEDRLRLNGVRLVLDGVLQSRGALLKAPYSDDAGASGLAVLDGTQMRNSMSRAGMDGFQVAISASGDAAVADALAAIDQLAVDFSGDRRWRIEQARVIDPADLPQFGRHGIVASLQPAAQTGDEAMAEARLGPDRLTSTQGWAAVAATGAPLAFGSGAPGQTPAPLDWIADAIISIPREAALAATTAAGAYAGFAEGRFGTLGLGERADFVVLSADPLNTSAQDMTSIVVRETWIGGQRVWSTEEAAD